MADQSTAPPSPAKPRRGLSLRAKLFLPVFVLLVLLGAATLYGSLQLAKSLATQMIDDRLRAGSEVFFREFKREEELLLAYIDFLDQFHFLANRFEATAEIGILEDRLFSTLEREGIGVTFLTLPPGATSPLPALGDLFTQVRRSGQPRFRYTSELSGEPVLVALARLGNSHEPDGFLLLQTSMGEDFLKRIGLPLGLSAILHDLNGKVMASGGDELSPMQLSPEQMKRLATEGKIYAEHDSPNGLVRHVFSLIPLGTSDLIILSIEAPVSAFVELQQTLVIRLLLTIAAVMVIGAAIYFRLVNNITYPAHELTEAAKALTRGNLTYRIENIASDELGEVAVAFNQMAEQLEQIYQEKSERETALAIAQEEAKTKAVIERKNIEVLKVNEELRGHLREISALYQLNQAMVSAPDLNVLFDRVLQVIIETLGCDQVVMLLYNPGESTLEVVRSVGLDSEALRQVRFNFDQGITGLAAQSLRQIYVKDVEKDPRYINYHGQIATRGSFVSSPLVIKGRLIGAVNLHKREIENFSSSELKMIQAIANQTAMAVDNAQLIEKARDLSNIDDLTGLANRRHFQEILKREVAQARRFGTGFSILMCDIDHFDQFNTQNGRMRGDALLRQIGQLLLKNTRGIDLVCRFGNEEFVILLPKTAKAGGVAAAEKLRKCVLAERFDGAGNSQPGGRLTVSFGVTEFPLDSKNIYELLNLADRAVYRAKQQGRNCTVAWEGPAPAPE